MMGLGSEDEREQRRNKEKEFTGKERQRERKGDDVLELIMLIVSSQKRVSILRRIQHVITDGKGMSWRVRRVVKNTSCSQYFHSTITS